jgi:FkbM family methyltransferase
MAPNRWTVGDAATPAPLRVLANLYVSVFGRKVFYRWNQRLLNLAVRGMGVGNPTSGLIAPAEDRFLRRMAGVGQLTVLDVGAYVGEYAARLRELAPSARIWSFEPHPATYKRLSAEAARAGFTAVNMGLSDKPGRATLYDYAASSDASGTSHATLHAQVIEGIHQGASQAVEVEVTTVDAFLEAEKINRVHLLKVDAEGHELLILQGASEAIKSGRVDVVQFEFNEMNVMSRVFFKDFYGALPGFSFYHMLVDGLAPIGAYQPRTHELFILQNVIAIRDDLEYQANLR